MVPKHMERCLTSLATRRKQTNTTMRQQGTSAKMAVITQRQLLTTRSAGEDVEHLSSHTFLLGIHKEAAAAESGLGFHIKLNIYSPHS